MATHDYVIDNSTGANVRADINSVLQAILTNNSSSSAPSTTAAYMWWADTTSGTLKIRNSSDNAWVELLQLDGTLTLEDGSASTPGLAFRDDLNTGIFSAGADTFDISTGGTGRIQITNSGMSINDNGDDFDVRIEGANVSNLVRLDAGNDRVGIGTDSPQNDFHLISGNTDLCKLESNNAGSTGAVLILFHSTASPADNDIVGTLSFRGKDSGGNETTFADIRGNALDVTNGTEDGELIFNTTAAGSFGERMRLNPGGRLLLGTSTTVNVGAPVGALYQIETTSQNAISCAAHRGTSNSSGSILILAKSRGTSAGSATAVADDDELGAIRFAGADGTDLESRGGEINCVVDGTPGSNDMPGRLQFKTTADGASTSTTRMTINSSGNVGVATTDISGFGGTYKGIDLASKGSGLAGRTDNVTIDLRSNTFYDGSNQKYGGTSTTAGQLSVGGGQLIFSNAPSGTAGATATLTERARLNDDGDWLVGKEGTSINLGTKGITMAFDGRLLGTTDGLPIVNINRLSSDGNLVQFYQATSLEGSISVSGSTVSYNGGHLSRWSQFKGISTTDKSARPTIYQGTVMSNLDDLCVWSYPDQFYTEQDKTDNQIPEGKKVGDLKKAAHTEENQQLNMTKISDTEGDKDVAGVFWTWDDENDDYYTNDFFIAMTGDMVIRVAASTTVSRGDLMISAGDGTAKPQADDIIRSSTIAKIISTNATATYADGSKAYPCVLMAC